MWGVFSCLHMMSGLLLKTLPGTRGLSLPVSPLTLHGGTDSPLMTEEPEAQGGGACWLQTHRQWAPRLTPQKAMFCPPTAAEQGPLLSAWLSQSPPHAF